MTCRHCFWSSLCHQRVNRSYVEGVKWRGGWVGLCWLGGGGQRVIRPDIYSLTISSDRLNEPINLSLGSARVSKMINKVTTVDWNATMDKSSICSSLTTHQLLCSFAACATCCNSNETLIASTRIGPSLADWRNLIDGHLHNVHCTHSFNSLQIQYCAASCLYLVSLEWPTEGSHLNLLYDYSTNCSIYTI